MKTQLLFTIASAGLLFAIAIQSANASSCSEEIRNLEKDLSSKSTQMGPVSRGTETTSAGAEAPKPGQVPETPATAAMNEAVGGRAASQEDVLRQNQGQPTASEAAQTGRSAETPQMSEAMASLQRARELDKAGKEAECMAAVQQARDQIPSQ
jgi:hypothetical protein